MDYQGQKLAELWISRILIAFAAAGFLAGYVASNFMLMVYINVAGLAVALLAVVPDWPFFNKHPLQWLPPLNPTGNKGTQRKEGDDSSNSGSQEQQQLLAGARATRSSSRRAA